MGTVGEFFASVRRVVATWTLNFINLFVFIITYGKHTATEGRFYTFLHKWSNWNLYFSCEPKVFLKAKTEEEICEFVRKASKVRVVGGGHSFNTGALCNDTLISLDNYNQVLKFDKDLGIITVQAGLRLRDFIDITESNGWDIPVMGTTHVQSIGGLVASDLHATGRESGYLSQQIESIRIINSKGKAETFADNSDVFKSALGGIGALGVVVEVTIKLVPRFLVKRVTTYVNRDEAEAALHEYVQRHEHVGFFYIGGLHAKKIRLTTYDRAQPYERITRFVYFKNFMAQIFDLLNGGYFLDFARFFPPFLDIGYFTWNNSFLGQPFINTAGSIFTSKLFFRHDEMEYAMPYDQFKGTIDDLMNYLDSTGSIALMEVRFTVKGAQTKSLLGPGAGRDSCFIEILPTLTHNTRKIFAATENFFESHGGRPHLGKFTTYTKLDMEKHFGKTDVQRWLTAREKQDPEKKFVNDFVRQVFLDETRSNPNTQRY